MTIENNTTGSGAVSPVKNLPLLFLGGVVLTLAGFAVGRAYPARSYQQLGTSSYLFDAHSGKICAPFRASEEAARAANVPPGSPMAEALARVEKENPKEKTSADLIRACGSE